MSPAAALALLLSTSLAAPIDSAPPPQSAPPPAGAPEASSGPAPDPSWDEAPASEPTPSAAPTDPAPAPASTQPQPPPPTVVVMQAPAGEPRRDDAPPARSSAAGQGMVITGALLTAFGGASLVFVAMPAYAVREVSKSRAEEDPIIEVQSRRDRYRRARIADDVMEGAFWTGVTMVGIGVPLLIAGTVIRKQARQEVAERVQLDASGVTVRF